jgi:integrase
LHHGPEDPHGTAGGRPVARRRRLGRQRPGLHHPARHPIEPRNFSRSFDRCIAAARVPRITVHGTRKTCASLLAALDVHPRVAMRILRHSKIAITMEVYTEVPSDATRDALRKLSDWLA